MRKHCIFLALASLPYAGQAVAQSSDAPVVDAFELCLEIAQGAGSVMPPDEWHRVVVRPHRDGTSTQVYLSTSYPLSMQVRAGPLTHPITSEEIPSGYCEIGQVETDTGEFRWRLRPVEVGNAWDSLSPLSSAESREQVLQIQEHLRENDEYAIDEDPGRPSPHGQNMMFFHCDFRHLLFTQVLPDGALETSQSWTISVVYAAEPQFGKDSSIPDGVRAGCPTG